ncbi:MAG: hypothetical protein AB7F36_16065 [Reyranellaceae bacterium]
MGSFEAGYDGSFADIDAGIVAPDHSVVIRILTIAAIALLVSAGALAHTAADQVCGGRFARLLKGYLIGPGELVLFLIEKEATDACLATLDPNEDDHRLIEGFVRSYRYPAEKDVAAPILAALCAKGRKLACAADFAHIVRNFRSKPSVTAEQRTILRELLSYDFPLVNALLGGVLLSDSASSPEERRQGMALLRRADAQGDWWAPWFISRYSFNDPDRPRDQPLQDVQRMQEKWRDRAITLGNLHVQNALLEEHYHHRRDAEALATAQVLARRDPLFFPREVARARMYLAEAYESGAGVAADPAQARRWRDAAKDLGLLSVKRTRQDFKFPQEN